MKEGLKNIYLKKLNLTDEIHKINSESPRKFNIKSLTARQNTVNPNIGFSKISQIKNQNFQKLNFNIINQNQNNIGRNRRNNTFHKIHIKTNSLGNFSTFNSTIQTERFQTERKPKRIMKKIIINRKYPFIIQNSNFSMKKFNGLPSIITSYNRKLVQNLNRENEKFFLSQFSVIKSKKFSERFRYYGEKEEKKENKEKEKFSALKAFKICKETKKEIEKIKNENHHSKKYIYEKIIKSISKAAIHFKRLDISIKEFYQEYKLKNHSYSNPNTKNLLFQIKEYNRVLVEKILDENKSCSLDFDIFKRTPLHWAAIRNFYEIIPKIVLYGADVEAKDFLGKTALHLAVMNNNYEAIVFLFLFYASPFTLSRSGKKAIDYAKNEKIKSICKRATALHVIHMFGKQENYFENVQRGFSFFVVGECKGELVPQAYSIIKNIADRYREKMYNY